MNCVVCLVVVESEPPTQPEQFATASIVNICHNRGFKRTLRWADRIRCSRPAGTERDHHSLSAIRECSVGD